MSLQYIANNVCNEHINLLWMHGLGADYSDFEFLQFSLTKSLSKNLGFILPNAPMKKVAINNNMLMPAWYDIYDLNKLEIEDKTGLIESSDLILNLISTLNLDPQNVILGGFSQGGALALYTLFARDIPFAGLVCFSGYLPLRDEFSSLKISNKVPLFIGHGKYDDVVPLDLAKKTKNVIVDSGLEYKYKEYPISHSVSPQQIFDLDNFIYGVLIGNH